VVFRGEAYVSLCPMEGVFVAGCLNQIQMMHYSKHLERFAVLRKPQRCRSAGHSVLGGQLGLGCCSEHMEWRNKVIYVAQLARLEFLLE
jgi:hypothetical protein